MGWSIDVNGSNERIKNRRKRDFKNLKLQSWKLK